MNTSINWLSDYVEIDLDIDRLSKLFTAIGLNCEGIDDQGDDIVLDLEVTSNRPDWLGHLGLARELAAATGKELKMPPVALPAGSGDINELTSVTVDTPELCPRYTARMIKNVKVGPSPKWLVDYLQAIGLRSVNNIVDITNFVLMEYSQPLHSFDFDKLTGGKIIVRKAAKGEKIVSIDETTCELAEGMLVIADAQKPVAVAGIMGGLDSEVSDSTTTILLEAAQFDPLATRHTSRALGLMSDSNFRFERGVDPVALEEASARAAQLICEIAGGEMVEGMIDVWPQPYESQAVAFRPSRTEKLLGVKISPEEQKKLLTMLGVAVEIDGDDKFLCTAPPFRADLTREVDYIEEIARLWGYDNIPLEHGVTHQVKPMSTRERIRRIACQNLNASGYSEGIMFSFVDDAEAALFGVDAPVHVDGRVRKSNNALRPTILPSLLRACKNNQDVGNTSISLFELASVFPPLENENKADEYLELGMLTNAELPDLRGAVEAMVEKLVPGATVDVVPADIAGFQQGVAAKLMLNGKEIGSFGRASEKVRDYYNIEKPVSMAAIKFQDVADQAQLVRTAIVPGKYPPIRRDLSLILDEAVTWGEIMEILDTIDQPLRTTVDYVTTYRGKQIPKGKKSLTMAMEYRSDEGTLLNEQVDELIAEIVAAMSDKLSAEVRMA